MQNLNVIAIVFSNNVTLQLKTIILKRYNCHNMVSVVVYQAQPAV